MKMFLLGGAALAATGLLVPTASAEKRHRHDAHLAAVAAAEGGRPLTIGGRRGRGIYRSGNDIIAPGGFSAHGYGYPPATPDERREALNARIRSNATGLYGYGVDGLGGTGFEDNRESGYSNPYWGNTFNRNVGYNGVPTALAFGPGFANRRLADHDPSEDEKPGPTPQDLGYDAEP